MDYSGLSPHVLLVSRLGMLLQALAAARRACENRVTGMNPTAAPQIAQQMHRAARGGPIEREEKCEVPSVS